MQELTAVGLGEILWDVLPDGRKLGGAPANFAHHVNQLGGVGIPVSRIGDDPLGHEALAVLSENHIESSYVTVDPEHPTGTVNATIDEQGVATYVFPDNVAWDFMTMREVDLGLAARADIICFGTLAQRSPVSREGIRSFLTAAPRALKIYDINLRQDFHTPDRIRDSLGLADVLKINDDELALVSGMFGLPTGQREALQALLEAHHLKLAVLTRGGDGALILSPDAVSDLPGVPVDVVDTIGAGDSFTAAMSLAYLKGWSLDRINRHAAGVAAYVCGRAGAMPSLPRELKIQ